MSVRAHRKPDVSARAAVLAVSLLLAAAITWFVPAGARAEPGGASARAKASTGVTMSVIDVSPDSPPVSYTKKTLTITLSLHNTTARAISGVTITGVRGDPITTQSGLDQAIAKPSPPNDAYTAPLRVQVRTALPAGATTRVAYRITTDIPQDADLCLCADAIYPLFFTAATVATDGTSTVLATAQTYVPSFKSAPQKLTVGWLWPLLDRPHRAADNNTFIDDGLALELAPGGRLDRLLSTAEYVAARGVPMTLLVDPDLIDELALMAAGPYKVVSGTTTTAGVGTDDAARWLQRLQALLAEPGMEISFTPLADPDVDSLQTDHMGWTVGLTPTQQMRVTDALGGRVPGADITWPAGNTLHSKTLETLIGQGTTTVVLNDSSLTRGSTAPATKNALAPLYTSAGTAVAGVTSTPIERWADAVLEPGGAGLGALPQLVSQVALRAVQDPGVSHYVLITPPRQLDPDPAVAERAILATSRTDWARPEPLRAAATALRADGHGTLVSRKSSSALSATVLGDLRYVRDSIPGLRAMFAGATGTAANTVATVLNGLPVGIQRCTSNSLIGATRQDAGRQTSQHADADPVTACAAGLATVVHGYRDGVSLVEPAVGTYTLTSRTSNLPVTVDNRLAVPVQVRLRIINASGGPGFRSDVLLRTIAANSRVQVHVPTHVDRVGRIDVRAEMSTPTDLPLSSIPLIVHSTPLGTIGIVITVIAAVVLALALVLRLVLRLRKRRAAGSGPTSGPPTAPMTGTA